MGLAGKGTGQQGAHWIRKPWPGAGGAGGAGGDVLSEETGGAGRGRGAQVASDLARPATPPQAGRLVQLLPHLPEDRLHKHPQRLDVDPGNKGFAEVHLEPAQQGSLQRQASVTPLVPSASDTKPRKGAGLTEQALRRETPRGQQKQRVGPTRPRRGCPGPRSPGCLVLEAQRANPRHMRGAPQTCRVGLGSS